MLSFYDSSNRDELDYVDICHAEEEEVASQQILVGEVALVNGIGSQYT